MNTRAAIGICMNAVRILISYFNIIKSQKITLIQDRDNRQWQNCQFIQVVLFFDCYWLV